MSGCAYLCLSASICDCVFVCVHVCVCLFASLYLPLCLWVSLSVPLCVSVCVSLYASDWFACWACFAFSCEISNAHVKSQLVGRTCARSNEGTVGRSVYLLKTPNINNCNQAASRPVFLPCCGSWSLEFAHALSSRLPLFCSGPCIFKIIDFGNNPVEDRNVKFPK